jgi:hypothetical protein
MTKSFLVSQRRYGNSKDDQSLAILGKKQNLSAFTLPLRPREPQTRLPDAVSAFSGGLGISATRDLGESQQILRL